jgi:hypothetical protein
MQPNNQWQKIYITRLYTEAAIIRGTLEENQIPVQVLNKQDSMYNVALGEIEIYVPMHLSELAKGLLTNSLEN